MWRAGARIPVSAARRFALELLDSQDQADLTQLVDIDLVELFASLRGLRRRVRDLMTRVTMEMPRFVSRYNTGTLDDPLRWHCLQAALMNSDLTPEELVPPDPDTELRNGKAVDRYGESREREYRQLLAPLIPVYLFRARAIFGQARVAEIETVVAKAEGERDATRNYRFPRESPISDSWAETAASGLVRLDVDASATIRRVGQLVLDTLGVRRSPVALKIAAALLRYDRYRLVGLKLVDDAMSQPILDLLQPAEQSSLALEAAAAVWPGSREMARDLFDRAMAVDRLDDSAVGLVRSLSIVARRLSGHLSAPEAADMSARLMALRESLDGRLDEQPTWLDVLALESAALLHAPTAFATCTRWDDDGRIGIDRTIGPTAAAAVKANFLDQRVACELVARLAPDDPAMDSLLQLLDLALLDNSHRGRTNLRHLIDRVSDLVVRDLPSSLRPAAANRLMAWMQTHAPTLPGDTVRPFAKLTSGEPANHLARSDQRTPRDESASLLIRLSGPWPAVEAWLDARADSLITTADRVSFLREIVDLPTDDQFWVRYRARELASLLVKWARRWDSVPAMQAATPSLLREFVLRHGVGLAFTEFRGDPLPEVEILDPQLLPDLMAGVRPRLSMMRADEQYRIVELVSSSSALPSLASTLRWAFDRWGDNGPRLPLGDLSADETVVRLLWQLLGHMDRSVRWRALHVARATAAIRPAVVSALLGRLQSRESSEFGSATLTFYWMSAQVALLLLAARLAHDTPGLVQPYEGQLKAIAVDEAFPHALMRELAKSAVLQLWGTGESGPSPSERLRVESANSPRSEWIDSQRPPYDKRHVSADRFRFDQMDTLPYWYSPVAEVFNVQLDVVASQAEHWIVDELGFTDDDWWHDEREISRERRYDEFSHRQGSIPRLESLHRYLELHGLFLAAGRLVDRAAPVCRDDGSYGTWSGWLGSHLATSDDWWLADLRSPVPPAAVPIRPLPDVSDWVRATDAEFDDIVRRESGDWVKVWESSDSHLGDRHQSVHLSSALVTPESAMSLMALLESVDSTSFRLPRVKSDEWDPDDGWPRNQPGFQLLGWLEVVEDLGRSLEDHDPFSRIKYHFERPFSAFRTAFALSPDHLGLTWRDDLGNPVVESALTSDPDSGHDEPRREEVNWSGTRVQRTALVRYLQSVGLDLMIDVQVYRSRPYSPGADDRESPFTSRLYRLRRDGNLERLASGGRTGRANPRGTRR